MIPKIFNPQSFSVHSLETQHLKAVSWKLTSKARLERNLKIKSPGLSVIFLLRTPIKALAFIGRKHPRSWGEGPPPRKIKRLTDFRSRLINRRKSKSCLGDLLFSAFKTKRFFFFLPRMEFTESDVFSVCLTAGSDTFKVWICLFFHYSSKKPEVESDELELIKGEKMYNFENISKFFFKL